MLFVSSKFESNGLTVATFTNKTTKYLTHRLRANIDNRFCYTCKMVINNSNIVKKNKKGLQKSFKQHCFFINKLYKMKSTLFLISQ